MRTTTVEHISSLQENPKNIRNICILAHVDHGKTTLADALVASNGIISSRLAGKLRYMDSRKDEQIRGITMKSSAVSLHFAKDNEEFLINLIDSPGHVDFSSEVSTAVRLCDGALVVVDAVEGVSPQTQVVLRQAWLENIRPCLVINKIDRLITQVKYTPAEAYLHLQRTLEQVNAITGKLFSSAVMEKSSNKTTDHVESLLGDDAAVSIEHWSSGLDEVDDSTLYFSPDLGNVIFASAIDGWGFSIDDFAAIYSKKLGLNADILCKTLWGDFYLDPKSKRIFKKAQSKGKKPLFVQFILENIWSIYDAVVIRRDKPKMEKIVQSLNLKISARDSRSTDPRIQLQAILGKWLSLSSVVLSMVVDKLPSPLEMGEDRIEKLLSKGLRPYESLPSETKDLKQAFLLCSSSTEAPVIAFVSKMFAVDESCLPKHKKRPLTQEEIAQRHQQAHEKQQEILLNSKPEMNENRNQVTMLEDSNIPNTHFIAFARVYSGVIKKGQHLFVLGPRHDPATIKHKQQSTEEKNTTDKTLESDMWISGMNGEGLAVAKSVDLGTNQDIAEFTVDNLYLLMGRELEALHDVPAGNVLGIGGLHNHILKTATVSSTIMCPPFTSLHIEARPIVRVALEPVHYADLPALSCGIRLLNQADPCVETYMARTGEHVIVAAGEVHLQKCIDDLKERFACVPFYVSSPIIPFRETIIQPPKTDMVNEAIAGDADAKTDTNVDKDKTLVEITTANKKCTIKIRAIPLPKQITRLLNSNAETIKLLVNGNTQYVAEVQTFYDELKLLFEKEDFWTDAVDRIWAFGPDRTGPNILLNEIPDYDRPSIWPMAKPNASSQHSKYDNSILSGFQLATLAGPLCDEPLMGVCFVIENITTETTHTSQTSAELPSPDQCSPSNNCQARTGMSSISETSKGTLNTDRANLETRITSITVTEISNIGTTDIETPNTNQICTGTSNSDQTGAESSNTCKTRGKLSYSNQSNQDSDQINKLIGLSDQNLYENDCEENVKSKSENSKESGSCNEDSDVDCDGRQLIGENVKKIGGLADNVKSPDEEGIVQTKMVNNSACDRFGPFSGQLMSAVKEGCKRAFQLQPMRLMVAMYTCHIQATAEVLGRMYAVIGKREGRVLSEAMMEGSDMFDVEAVLPVAESFGFSEEIRKRTSGLANPQLVFSHWEVIDIDPYWVPTTEEEYTHFGAKADSDNQARKYMNTVRKRKGLYIEEKTVEYGEKQRTMKK